jgi:hypothetical protein
MKKSSGIVPMNGRTQLPVIAYLKEKCNVDCVDMVTEAGPVRILADSKDRALVDSIKRRVEISTEKHRSRHVAVVGHFDCAGNPVSEGTQKEQIRKSIKTVLSWNFKVNVRGLWVDENWVVHEDSGENAAQGIIRLFCCFQEGRQGQGRTRGPGDARLVFVREQGRHMVLDPTGIPYDRRLSRNDNPWL